MVAGRSGAVPNSVAWAGWRGNEALWPALRNRLRQGAAGLQECITGGWEFPVSRKLSLLGISPGLCRGGAATFQWLLTAIASPYLLRPFFLRGVGGTRAQVRMLVSERYPPAVQSLPAQSLASVESHALGVEPRHDLFQISRPSLQPSFLASTVSVILENLQEVISLHSGHGGAHPGGLDSGRPVSIIVDGHPLAPSRQAPYHLWNHGIIVGIPRRPQYLSPYWYLPTMQAPPRFLPPAEGIVESKTDRIPLAARMFPVARWS